uniref:YbeY metalloendoribonuclease n=1 Tax=Chelydra serpentina TaxID=8475 RepID=A0A8C3SHL6_CHESE
MSFLCLTNKTCRILQNFQILVSPMLTFGRASVFQNLKAGDLPQPSFQDEYNLGDVFLGVEYIYQQCQENGEDYYSILTVTAAHGLCHLLGYQHNTEAEWEQVKGFMHTYIQTG